MGFGGQAVASPRALIRYLLLSFTWAPQGGRAGREEGAKARGRGGAWNGNAREVESAFMRTRDQAVEMSSKVSERCGNWERRGWAKK